MQVNTEDLLQNAKEILYNNLRSGFTVPTAKLYPFQWNWDSGFVSIGFSNFDVDAAISEVQSLLSGQWENGMIPHIIFHSENETTYFPNWDFWEASINPGAPTSPKTSGITQPPVLGFVLEWLYKRHPKNPKVQAFIKEAYPKVVNSHRFWYKYRDPKQEGLIFIYHPWESGRDNSPLWDDALSYIDLEKAGLPEYKRRDITIAAVSERPTSKQYDQYVYLIQLGKKHQFDQAGIAEESEFLIQDTLMNAMLIRSNQGLITLGKELGYDTSEIETWQQKSKQAFENKLWNEELGIYTCYDLRNEKQLPYWEIGGLSALFAEIPSEERANRMIKSMQSLVDNYFIVPSFDVHHEWYDSRRYWRGPVWPQMNWMLYHGLLAYQQPELAEKVKDHLLELVTRFGFYEYFEAQRDLADKEHGGYGGNHFSWTASSVIDFILNPKS